VRGDVQLQSRSSIVGAVAVALSIAGCAPSAGFHVGEALVVVESDAPFVRHPGFPERVEEVLSLSLEYWDGDWSHLAGRTITFSTGPYVYCGGAHRASGCFDGNIRVSTWDPGTGTVDCVEQTVLAHEIGHAVHGDRLHSDPRWMEFETLRDRLVGRVGYSAEGEVECEIAVSVWRHPRGRP
jgi:hypothetical protein